MKVGKWMVAVVLVLSIAAAPGCMGRMALSKKVTEFNLNVTDSREWREAVFLGLHLIGVYPLAAFVDLFILNAFEYWNGTNPMSGEDAVVDS